MNFNKVFFFLLFQSCRYISFFIFSSILYKHLDNSIKLYILSCFYDKYIIWSF